MSERANITCRDDGVNNNNNNNNNNKTYRSASWFWQPQRKSDCTGVAEVPCSLGAMMDSSAMTGNFVAAGTVIVIIVLCCLFVCVKFCCLFCLDCEQSVIPRRVALLLFLSKDDSR